MVAADSVLLVGQERGRSRLLWQALRREVRFRRWQLWEVAAPVEDGGVYKAGRVLPIKFSLTGASAGLQITGRLLVARIVGGAIGPEVNAESSGGANDGNRFRYDAGQYIFNWSTKGLAPGTYRLRLDLGDGVLRTTVVTLQ